MTSQIPLSEAMLLGSTMLKPCGGGHSDPRSGWGCALDMAVVAVGGHWWIDSPRYWPWLNERRLNAHFDDIIEIAWRFDRAVMQDKSMTFDAFVDWVREIEPKVEAAAPVVPVEIRVTSEVWDD